MMPQATSCCRTDRAFEGKQPSASMPALVVAATVTLFGQHLDRAAECQAAGATQLASRWSEERDATLVMVPVAQPEDGEAANLPVDRSTHAEARLLAGQAVVSNAELLEDSEERLLVRCS